MAYERRELEGSLFVNDKKVKEGQRDFDGSCKIDGKEYWISAWKKPMEKDGKKSVRLSLAFELKKEQLPDDPTGESTQSEEPEDDFAF